MNSLVFQYQEYCMRIPDGCRQLISTMAENGKSFTDISPESATLANLHAVDDGSHRIGSETSQAPPLYETIGGIFPASYNTNQPPIEIKQQKPPTSSRTGKVSAWAIILAVCAVALLTVALVVTSVVLSKDQQPTTATSCVDLKQRGLRSGIYIVADEDSKYEYEVFCDMDSDGGGWTLVASVHEDNIVRKCDVNDRWSTYASADSYNREYSAWENKLTFGNVRNATFDDYKNRGYFSLQGKDVMVWHVPANTPLDFSKDQATLRYRTTDNFLQHYGGNLFTLFSDEYYELSIRQNYQSLTDEEIKLRTQKVMDALERNNDTIKEPIPDWYPYEQSYDYPSNIRIYDDGLYSTYGNEIYTNILSEANTMKYDEEVVYDFIAAGWWASPEVSALARRSYPFMMITVIGNENDQMQIFFSTVIDSTENTKLNYTVHENVLKSENYRIQYSCAQTFTNNSASASEFHFFVTSEEEWRSIKEGYFNFALTNYGGSSGVRSIGTYVDGVLTNFISGYTLLARKNGMPITGEMLDKVAMAILTSITGIPDLFNEFPGSDGLAIPVIFDKGDARAALNMTPDVRDVRREVDGGYIQFRAYNKVGFPNALCPGIKVDNPFPEYLCIGGISNYTNLNDGTCGDFAGWNGKSDTLGENGRSEYAHSADDVNSVIMIFYR